MLDGKFPRYTDFEPKVPTWCVTPTLDGCIHRFFDTSPFSPSGRYLAVTQFLQEENLPKPGEKAKIVLVDLETGKESIVSETLGWETQMGANLNWGTDDETLYFNNVDPDTWKPYIVKLNPFTRSEEYLEGSIYRISPDGKQIISADATKMRRTQYGYGVVIPDEYVGRNYGLASDDGLYMTDTETGKQKLLVSMKDVFKNAEPKIDEAYYENGECYGFHCKYNPQGDRLLFTMRWMPKQIKAPWNLNQTGGLEFFVVTMKPDGSDIHVAVGPKEWEKVGHHINWFPDGKRLSMNLCIDGDSEMYLVQVNYDGTGLKKITESVPGSGHPTVHPNERQILTDSYEHEKMAEGDGTVPLRWIDLDEGTEETLVKINVANDAQKRIVGLRVDPHPAWDNTHQFIAFNGFVEGTRRVFVSDMRSVLKG